MPSQSQAPPAEQYGFGDDAYAVPPVVPPRASRGPQPAGAATYEVQAAYDLSLRYQSPDAKGELLMAAHT